MQILYRYWFLGPMFAVVYIKRILHSCSESFYVFSSSLVILISCIRSMSDDNYYSVTHVSVFISGWHLLFPTNWLLCCSCISYVLGLLRSDWCGLGVWGWQIVQKSSGNDWKTTFTLFSFLLVCCGSGVDICK